MKRPLLLMIALCLFPAALWAAPKNDYGCNLKMTAEKYQKAFAHSETHFLVDSEEQTLPLYKDRLTANLIQPERKDDEISFGIQVQAKGGSGVQTRRFKVSLDGHGAGSFVVSWRDVRFTESASGDLISAVLELSCGPVGQEAVNSAQGMCSVGFNNREFPVDIRSGSANQAGSGTYRFDLTPWTSYFVTDVKDEAIGSFAAPYNGHSGYGIDVSLNRMLNPVLGSPYSSADLGEIQLDFSSPVEVRTLEGSGNWTLRCW